MKSIISLLPAKGSLPDFLNKLRAKKQTEAQQQQASHAISLYYPPEQLAPDDVKEFLTFLAVKRSVTASTQNQAVNSLLFFFDMF